MAALYHSGGASLIADSAAQKKFSRSQRAFAGLYAVSAGRSLRPHCLRWKAPEWMS
jgi:hypothetical protein